MEAKTLMNTDKLLYIKLMITLGILSAHKVKNSSPLQLKQQSLRVLCDRSTAPVVMGRLCLVITNNNNSKKQTKSVLCVSVCVCVCAM